MKKNYPNSPNSIKALQSRITDTFSCLRFLTLITLAFLFLLNSPVAGQQLGKIEFREPVKLRAVYETMNTRVEAPDYVQNALQSASFRTSAPQLKTATINVTFGPGALANPEAMAAFQFAIDIWAMTVVSSVPIEIFADFADLGPGVLAQAGPTFFVSDFVNAVPNTFYPAALADALSGENLFPETSPFDLTVSLGNGFNWYFGTDMNPSPNQFDFATVALHEIGHGMGFTTIRSFNNGIGSLRAGEAFIPAIYSRFMINGQGTPLLSFPDPSLELGNQFTSNNLFINGTFAMAANGGMPPQIYAPSTFAPGSSIAHWDEDAFQPGTPNSLMTPFLNLAESIQDVGDITRGFFKDMGWIINEGEFSPIIVVPASLNEELFVENSSTQNLVISNVSNSFLQFTLSVDPANEWLDVDPEQGIIAPGETQNIEVQFDASGLTKGVRNGTITVMVNDPENTSIEVPVRFRVLDGTERPVIAVAPDALQETLNQFETSTQTLTIFNNGDDDLAFNISIQDMALSAFKERVIATSHAIAENGFSFKASTVIPSDSEASKAFTIHSKLANAVKLNDAGPNALSIPLLATDFESFALGDLNGQEGWFARFENNWIIDNSDPFEGQQHLRGVSDGQGPDRPNAPLVLSPTVVIGEDVFSSMSAQVKIEGSGTTWEIIPQSPTAGSVVTRLRFNPDGTISALTPNGFEDVNASTPNGYFELRIVVDRSNSQFTIFFDDNPVFSGIAFARDIEQLALLSQMETQGPTLDIDNLEISDGDPNAFWLSVSPISGIVPFGESREVQVFFDARTFDPGVLMTDLLIESNDPDNPEVTVPVTLTIEEPAPPTIAVMPESLEETLKQNNTSLQTLTIENLGGEPLDFEVDIEDAPDAGSNDFLTRVSTTSQALKEAEFLTPEYVSIPPQSREVAKNEFLLSTQYLSNSAVSLKTNLFSTGFEDFDQGDVNGQQGWAADFPWLIDSTNAFEGNNHLRGQGSFPTPIPLVAISPTVAIGTETTSGMSAQINVTGTGTTWFIEPSSPTAGFINTRIIINPDRSAQVLVSDGVGGAKLEPLISAIPDGYFELKVITDRNTAEFRIFIDQVEIFKGQGFAGDIEQVVFVSLAETDAPTLDVDNLEIFDGDEAGPTFWLSVFPTSGTVPRIGGPDPATFDLDVRFSTLGLEPGIFETNIIISSNDPENAEVKVPVTLTVEEQLPPLISVDPDSLEDMLNVGDSSTQILTISNDAEEGDQGLIFQIGTVSLPDWLTVEPVIGGVPAGESQEVVVTFDASGLSPGEFSASIIIISNDPASPVVTVPVSLTVTAPSIAVNPEMLEETLFSGEMAIQDLTISNSGDGDLDFDISIAGDGNSMEEDDTTANQFDEITVEKLRKDAELSPKESLTGSNNLLAFGENILDEDFEGDIFPPEGWQTIDNEGSGVIWSFAADFGEGNYSGNGEAATASSDAFGAAPYDTELWTPIIDVSGKSNIVVKYNSNYQNFGGNDFLDLDISTDGGTNWVTIISWNEDHGAFRAQPGEIVSLLIDSYLDGANEFILRWRYYDPNPGDDFDWYAQIDDVEITNAWLLVDPAASTISPDSSMNVKVTFDASGLEPGTFMTELLISSNDPENPSITVPVELNVVLPEVISFILVNADTDEDIMEISEGDIINLAKLPTKNLNIRATTAPDSVGSVVFGLNEDDMFRVDNEAPYAMFGDNQGDFFGFRLPVGPYNLRATAYSGANATGLPGETKTINFEVVDENRVVSGFLLINADNNSAIGPINNGDIIDLSTLPTKNLNIQAITDPAIVGSVVFDFNGQQRFRVENLPPYALFGDFFGNFRGVSLPPGTYSVTATPFSFLFGLGDPGLGKSIEFELIEGNGITASVNASREEAQLFSNENMEISPIENRNIKVYPNPVKDRFAIALSGQLNERISLSIFDLKGRQFYSYEMTMKNTNTTVEVDIAGLSMTSGIYILKIDSDLNESRRIRLIKNE